MNERDPNARTDGSLADGEDGGHERTEQKTRERNAILASVPIL